MGGFSELCLIPCRQFFVIRAITFNDIFLKRIEAQSYCGEFRQNSLSLMKKVFHLHVRCNAHAILTGDAFPTDLRFAVVRTGAEGEAIL